MTKCPKCGNNYDPGAALCPPCNKADRLAKRRLRDRNRRLNAVVADESSTDT